MLPQEVGSWRPAVRPERRRAYAAELSAATPGALALLAQVASGGASPAALEAFAGWVRLAQGRDGSGGPLLGSPPPPPGCDAAALANHPLTAAALDALASPEAFDAAVEAVSELIRATAAAPAAGASASDADDAPPPGLDPRAAPLVSLLVPRVMALRPRFAAMSRDGDGGDDARGMARLFAEVGEAFLDLIATGAADVLAPVEALLEVSAHPDDDVASVCFTFWGRLARALPGGDGERERRRALFAPAFAQLVRNVAGRVRYPDDYGAWSRDQRADFKRARHAVGDACLDAAGVLGGEATLGLLSEPLAALAAASAAGAPFDWRRAEAALFCVRCVAPAAPPPDSPLLPQLLAALATLPPVPEVRYTACHVISVYSPWVATALAAGAPAAAPLLPQLLATLTGSLEGGGPADGSAAADARGAAAQALRHLARAAKGALLPALPALMALQARAIAAEDADDAPAGASPLILASDDVLDVTRAAAHVAAALPDGASLAGALDALLAPSLATLAQLLPADVAGAGAPPPPPPPAPPLSRAFDRVAAAVRDFADASGTGGPPAGAAADAVAAAFLQRVWPLLERALLRCGDETAGEHACRAVKHALRAAGAQRMAPLLPPLGALLAPLFSARRHACLLFAAGELAREFAANADAAQHLSALVATLLREAAAGFPTAAAFDAAPDVADDAFLLASRALKLLPGAVLESATLGALLDAAAPGSHVRHREACGSVLVFTGSLLRRRDASALAALSAALPPRGPRLAAALLGAALVTLPRGSLSADAAEAMHALLALAAQAGRDWIHAALGALPEIAAPRADIAAFAAVADAVAAGGPAQPSEKALGAALEELAQVVRRSRRALDAAHTALCAGL